jgi:hypothetical protein
LARDAKTHLNKLYAVVQEKPMQRRAPEKSAGQPDSGMRGEAA